MLRIEQIRPGMVVKSDVRDDSGRLLLSGGSAVEARHISLFLRWGLDEVDVGVAGAEADPELDPELLARAEAMLADHFSLANTDHPAMRELHRLAVLRQARRLSRGR